MGVFFILSKIFKAKVNKVVNIFSLIGAITLVMFICLLLLLN
ncbi:putative membrane protein [Clostridioides difficile CD45]|nr:putative membrane protein [Clostridioides difficile CD45]